MLMKKTHPQYIEGSLSISGKGTGYVRVPDSKQDDIEIDPSFLNTGLHRDKVKVLLHPKRKGESQCGEIIEIIARAKAGFSGVLEEEKGIYFLVPSDPKMYVDIIIPKDKLNGAKVGQKIFAQIISWKDSKMSPEGEVIEILGKKGENNAEMRGIALERGFSAFFPKAVNEEAKKLEGYEIAEEEIKKRRDLRGVPTFTIDPEDAKDFDDAISILELENGDLEIGVHIADVSHFVRLGNHIDKEAYKRGTSVYLVDRTIPMLPEILSNDLCSLKPNVDRLSMSAVFVITRDGHVKKEWFGKTIIHSDKRFTYEEAQGILDKKHGLFHLELNILNHLAKKFKKERFERGAISLDQEEVKFILDPHGAPLKVIKKVRGDTHKLVEEFMLLANRKIAEFMSRAGSQVFVYRIHDLPDREKIENLILFLKKLGYHIKSKQGDKVSSYDLNELLEKLEGKAEKDMIQTMIVRSMQKAVYSTKNVGHYGLAFKHYTHFTSPIRRYPDLMVHRLLYGKLEGHKISADAWKDYEKMSAFASEREKFAADAERASIKYKQVEYMSSRIGQIYEGVITGVTDWGIYVEEIETKCEGLIRLRDLGDDFYIYNEKELSVIGKKTRKKYRIGDKLKIKVKDADLNQRTIDYVLV